MNEVYDTGGNVLLWLPWCCDSYGASLWFLNPCLPKDAVPSKRIYECLGCGATVTEFDWHGYRRDRYPGAR